MQALNDTYFVFQEVLAMHCASRPGNMLDHEEDDEDFDDFNMYRYI